MKNYTKLFVAAATIAATMSTAKAVTFEDVDTNILSDVKWTQDTVYILKQAIFVGNGATLTIEPGTIIRGITNVQSGISAEPGALIVAPNSKLIANGTPDDPIVFTSIDDPNVRGGVNTIPPSFTTSADAPVAATFTSGVDYGPGVFDYSPDGPTSDNGWAYQGFWGGLVVLNDGYVAQQSPSTDISPPDGLPDEPYSLVIGSDNNDPINVGLDYIEGITPSAITESNLYAVYGGKDDANNSGVMRWVSVRYAGFEIGADNELNSVTLGGVGSNTVLEWIDSAFNIDDGLEMYGAILNTRFIFCTSIQDDQFDTDEGYRGVNQFWFAAHGSLSQVRGGHTGPGNGSIVGQLDIGNDYQSIYELDGAENGSDGLPATNFSVYNFTAIVDGDSEYPGYMDIDENVSLSQYNSVIVDSDPAADPVNVGNAKSPATRTGVALADTLFLFSDADPTGTVDSGLWDSLTAYTELTTNPLKGTSIYTKNGLDPTLAVGAAPRTAAVTPPAGFIQTDYSGAMLDNNFLAEWTVAAALDALPTTNVPRAELTLGVSGSNPTITFDTASGGKYVVEVSTDGRVFTPINGGALVAGTGSPVTVTDSGTSLTSGAPVSYRAFRL